MMPRAARSGFGWKKGYFCRKPATLVSGPLRAALDSEKSPFSSAGVKTVIFEVVLSCVCRWPWYATKKKNLSRPLSTLGITIGPPIAAPNWLRFRISLGRPNALLKNRLAFRSLLRT